MLRLLRPVIVSSVLVNLIAPTIWPTAVQALPGSDVDLTHDMSLCERPEPGKAYLLVSVSGFKDEDGNVRAQIYSKNPDEFLEKGKKLVRVDVKTEGDGQKVCVPLPTVDTYALVVMHDRNANGKADFFSEGFGFSNNPKLGLAPPDAKDVMFAAKAGVTEVEITLNYMFGGDEEKAKARRNLRRR